MSSPEYGDNLTSLTSYDAGENHPAVELHGADVEIFHHNYPDGSDIGVAFPNSLSINGQEILLPDGSEIIVHPIKAGKEAAKLTVTVFVRSLRIRP